MTGFGFTMSMLRIWISCFFKCSGLVFINVPSLWFCKFSIKLLMNRYLQDALEGSKPLTAFRSFDYQNRRETVQVPTRSKSVLSAFFVKQKTPKLKAGSFLWIPLKPSPPLCKSSELISFWFKPLNNDPVSSRFPGNHNGWDLGLLIALCCSCELWSSSGTCKMYICCMLCKKSFIIFFLSLKVWCISKISKIICLSNQIISRVWKKLDPKLNQT